MPFTMFQMPYLGNGMTIGLDAIVHVLISHGVAIGVFGIIVLSEYLGFKKGSPGWERLARDMLRFFTIIITGIGAILGVGIWFVTSTLEPRGIASLLRIFFWPWFIEWFAFASEVVVLLIYYYTWDRWIGALKKRHIYLGVSYIVFAVISAFLITGILGFMLTPDGWPWAPNFWQAFFNPTFLPQLLLRLSAAYTLGAVYSMAFLLFTRHEPAFRREALRVLGRIGVVALILAAGSAAWYFSVVPSTFKAFAVFSVLTSRLSQHPEIFWAANAAGAVLLLGLALTAGRGSVALPRVLVIPAILVAIAFTSEFERIREFIRGPYIIPGYMYANQVLLEEKPFFDQGGLLPNSYWYNATATGQSATSQGAYLFGQNCSVCHTIGGVNDIRARVKGRTEDGILAIVGHTHEMVPFMAPFSGSLQERRALASYLFGLANGNIQQTAPSRFMGIQ